MPERPSMHETPPPSPEAQEVLTERLDRWSVQLSAPNMEAEGGEAKNNPNVYKNSGVMFGADRPVANRSEAGRHLMKMNMAPPLYAEFLTRQTLKYTPNLKTVAKVFATEEGQPYAVGRIRPGEEGVFLAVRDGEEGEEGASRRLPVNEHGLMSEPLEVGETLVMVHSVEGSTASPDNAVALTVEGAATHAESNAEVWDDVSAIGYIINQRVREKHEVQLDIEQRRREAEAAAEAEAERRRRSAMRRPRSADPEPRETEPVARPEKGPRMNEEQRELLAELGNARERFAKISAKRMNKASDRTFSKADQAEFDAAYGAYQAIRTRALARGLEFLNDNGYVNEEREGRPEDELSKSEWAALFTVYEMASLRQDINTNRLELIKTNEVNEVLTGSKMAQFVYGGVAGGLTAAAGTAVTFLSGPLGSGLAMIFGGGVGALVASRSGRRVGVREGVEATTLEHGEDSEMARRYEQLSRQSVEDASREQDNLREMVAAEQRRVKRAMGTAAFRGAVSGGLGAFAGYSFISGVAGIMNAESAVNAASSPDVSAGSVDTFEPSALSGDELLEMHADDPTAARDIVPNEGPYSTFEQMGIPEDQWDKLYENKDLMNSLGDETYPVEGQDSGWGHNNAGEISDDFISEAYSEAGMETQSVPDFMSGEGLSSAETQQMMQELSSDITDAGNYESVSLHSNDLPAIFELIQSNPVYEQMFTISDRGMTLNEVPADNLRGFIEKLTEAGYANAR